MKYWNRLPASLVVSPSVSIFKKQLDSAFPLDEIAADAATDRELHPVNKCIIEKWHSKRN